MDEEDPPMGCLERQMAVIDPGMRSITKKCQSGFFGVSPPGWPVPLPPSLAPNPRPPIVDGQLPSEAGGDRRGLLGNNLVKLGHVIRRIVGPARPGAEAATSQDHTAFARWNSSLSAQLE